SSAYTCSVFRPLCPPTAFATSNGLPLSLGKPPKPLDSISFRQVLKVRFFFSCPKTRPRKTENVGSSQLCATITPIFSGVRWPRRSAMGVAAMPVAAISEARRPKISPRFLPVIDRVLATGLKFGNAGKHAAINKVLQLVPEWRRGDCWQRIRHLQKTLSVPNRQQQVGPANSAAQAQLAHPSRTSWRRWSAEEDLKLLDWAGYEPVDKISQRLNRSIRAIRFRLCALGMSGKVTDGWSLRELRKLLRVSPAKLKQFIGSGMLRVRDPRVTARSLAALCQRSATFL